MWIERSTMVVSAMLPGILKWFQVVDKKVEEFTPIRFACEKMEEVNKQLNSLINQYVSDPQRNVNPLTMRLQVTKDLKLTTQLNDLILEFHRRFNVFICIQLLIANPWNNLMNFRVSLMPM